MIQALSIFKRMFYYVLINNKIESILITEGENFTIQLKLIFKLTSITGFFVTDNESMHDFASQVLKVSLNGLSLTVISFTIVFLFHGVGGGLFCGTVLFRLVFFF